MLLLSDSCKDGTSWKCNGNTRLGPLKDTAPEGYDPWRIRPLKDTAPEGYGPWRIRPLKWDTAAVLLFSFGFFVWILFGWSPDWHTLICQFVYFTIVLELSFFKLSDSLSTVETKSSWVCPCHLVQPEDVFLNHLRVNPDLVSFFSSHQTKTNPARLSWDGNEALHHRLLDVIHCYLSVCHNGFPLVPLTKQMLSTEDLSPSGLWFTSPGERTWAREKMQWKRHAGKSDMHSWVEATAGLCKHAPCGRNDEPVRGHCLPLILLFGQDSNNHIDLSSFKQGPCMTKLQPTFVRY